MLTRSVTVLILAAPLALVSGGCASTAFKPMARVSRQSAAVSSSHTDRLLQLAQRYEKQRNYEGALRLYRQAQNASPGDPRVESSIAAIAARQGRPVGGPAERQLAETHDAVQAGSTGQSVNPPGHDVDRDTPLDA